MEANLNIFACFEIMTKNKEEKDPLKSSDNKNPLLETENEGKASGVSQEMFEAILGSRLEMVPSDLNPPKESENQDDPKPVRKGDADSEDELWFRFFINNRLDVDPPTPDPSNQTEASTPTPDISHLGKSGRGNENLNYIPGFLPFGAEGVNSSSSPINVENTEGQEIQSILEEDFVERQPPSTQPRPKENEFKNDVAHLILGFETRSDHSVENDVTSSSGGMFEVDSKPEMLPNKKSVSILALTIPLLLIMLSVGGWKLRDLNLGYFSSFEPEVASIQSLPIDIPSVVDEQDSPLPEVNPASPIYDLSILTQIQKDRVYKASLTYLAENEEEAVYLATSIGYVPNEGHPATMCGPLAVSILRDAFLIDRYVNLEDFWLLNPRDVYTVSAILEKYFPKEHYHWYQTSTPINYYNFTSHPLYTGDFLYLFAGHRGTFEHMILVTRVDEAGRAYSVSPLETSDGYSIKEVMLYDPNLPGEGYFYEITNNKNVEFGLTGLGGFWLWRRLTPVPEPNFNDLAFGQELDAIFDAVGGDWYAYIKKVDERVIYSREVDEIIHPASVIKVPLAMLFFHALDYQDGDIYEYLSERGTGGRTYQQLLTAMLVESEENATQIIENWLNDRIDVKDTFAKWGVLDTSISPRRTTAEEMGWIFEGLYQGNWVKPEEREIILELLSEFTPSDNTRLGVIQNFLNREDRFFNKRGSLIKGRVIVADVAIIEIDDEVFVIALFGHPGTEDETPTFDDLEAAIEEAAPVIWEYLSQE